MPDQQPRDVRKVPKSTAHVNKNLLPAALPALAEEVQRLLAAARENPFWQFEIMELARMTNHSVFVLQQINKQEKGPFISGKSRPEWLTEWLRNNPGWVPSKG